MGRDKPKKFSKMGYFEKEEYKNEMAKKYGIQGTEYRDSRGNTQTRRNDAALKAAMRNDFDYRTSASHMDGVKGNASMKDFTKYERKAVKLHKQAGNGGEYSSNKDITGVTNNLVNDYRKNLANSISANQQVNTEVESNSPLQDYTDPIEFEHSDKVKNAKSRVGKYNMNLGNKNLFGMPDDDTPPAKNDQAAAADTFVNDYKADLSTAANLKENKAQNINNAIDSVRSIYRSQFM